MNPYLIALDPEVIATYLKLTATKCRLMKPLTLA